MTDEDIEKMISFIVGEVLVEIAVGMYRVTLTFIADSTAFIFLKNEFSFRFSGAVDWSKFSVDPSERELCGSNASFCFNQGRKCKAVSLNSDRFMIEFESGGQIMLDLRKSSGEYLEIQIPGRYDTNRMLVVR